MPDHATTVRDGVATADLETASLQVAVAHAAWTGQDAYGVPTYAGAVSRQALVEPSTRAIRALDGRETVARTKVTILRPTPFTLADRLTLPDGSTPPLLAVEGMVDPLTGAPYFLEIWCG